MISLIIASNNKHFKYRFYSHRYVIMPIQEDRQRRCLSVEITCQVLEALLFLVESANVNVLLFRIEDTAHLTVS